MNRPLLIYDGDCGFCRRWIGRWQRATGDRIDYAPSQRVADQFPHISPIDFAQAVILVEPAGQITRGAEAIFRALALGSSTQWLAWCYQHLLPFRWIAEWGYRLVAERRKFFSKFL